MRFTFLATVLWATNLVSHPTHMSHIRGTQINLQSINHSFAGSIRNKIVAGYKQQGKFISELNIITKDQKTVSQFKSFENQNFGGDLIIINNGQEETHSVRLLELNKEENIYVMSFDGIRTEVFVSADSFENGHYINPEYSMQFNGERVHFKLEDGQACYGYSLHLITMIMSTYIFS